MTQQANNNTNNFGTLTITALVAVTLLRPGQRRRNPRQAAARRELAARCRSAVLYSNVGVVRALELLFGRQTDDEQWSRTTRHLNQRGFAQHHASLGSWLVDEVIAEGREAGRPESELLRGKALEMGRKIALHYCNTQLVEATIRKHAPLGFVLPRPTDFGFKPEPVDTEALAVQVALSEAPRWFAGNAAPLN